MDLVASDDEIIQAMHDEKGFWNAFTLGNKLEDCGLARHAGKRVLWAEFATQQQRVGIDIEIYSLVFAFAHNAKMVLLSFQSCSAPGKTHMNAKQRFACNARLFQQMLNSVDFFGRYETTFPGGKVKRADP